MAWSASALSSARARSRRLLAAGILAAMQVGAVPRVALPQEGVALDRWLVSWPVAIAPLDDEARHPLSTDAGQAILPDRDAVVGPAYWSLVRRAPSSPGDIGAWIDLEADALDPLPAEEAPGFEGGGPALAHTYVRSPSDRTLRLVISRPRCRTVAAWLNGQRIAELAVAEAGEAGESGERTDPVAELAEIRLGAGWNTLLVAISAGDCPARLGGWLLPGSFPPGKDEEPSDSEDMRVQASQPPGMRRSQPAGFIEASALELSGELVWEAEAEDLLGTLSVPLTTWGRGAGEPPPRTAPEAPQRPTAAPELDLTGRWELRIFAPQGITNATAEFDMTEDGSLSGEVQGRRLGGELEGWVSRRDFRFTVETGRQSLRLTYTGSASSAGDSIRGTLSFGEGGDFSFGFRGARAGTDAAGEGEESEDEAPDEPRAPGAGPGARQPRDGLPGGQPPGGMPAAQGQAPGALARQALLPPREVRPPAPEGAEVRIEVGGERQERTVRGLEPARAVGQPFDVPFDDLRKASLSSSQVKLRVGWRNERREMARELPAELLLERLHEPIVLRGWSEAEGVLDEDEPSLRILDGTWRIPDALSGFTLELRTSGAPGEYRLSGEAMGGERVTLCAPCREGDRLELEVRVSEDWEGTATVRIVEPGYPATTGNPSVPAAREWLDALRGGGNRRYLELSARFAEEGS